MAVSAARLLAAMAPRPPIAMKVSTRARANGAVFTDTPQELVTAPPSSEKTVSR
jgi:hypothetical protein